MHSPAFVQKDAEVWYDIVKYSARIRIRLIFIIKTTVCRYLDKLPDAVSRKVKRS